jgi:hypothetical protein
MNDSEYTARWRTLAAQLNKLEQEAGIGAAAAGSREATRRSSLSIGGAAGEWQGGGGQSAAPASVLLEPSRGQELRALYFGIPQAALRRSLIAKHRELELLERTETRTRLEDGRRQLESLKRRPSEGWWIAAIVGATLVIVGYALFGALGAIAAGVVALFVGNGIEQSARRRFEQAVSLAQEDLRAAEAAADEMEQLRNVFSEREGATGEQDRPLDALTAAGQLHGNGR